MRSRYGAQTTRSFPTVRRAATVNAALTATGSSWQLPQARRPGRTAYTRQTIPSPVDPLRVEPRPSAPGPWAGSGTAASNTSTILRCPSSVAAHLASNLAPSTGIDSSAVDAADSAINASVASICCTRAAWAARNLARPMIRSTRSAPGFADGTVPARIAERCDNREQHRCSSEIVERC